MMDAAHRFHSASAILSETRSASSLRGHTLRPSSTRPFAFLVLRDDTPRNRQELGFVRRRGLPGEPLDHRRLVPAARGDSVRADRRRGRGHGYPAHRDHGRGGDAGRRVSVLLAGAVRSGDQVIGWAPHELPSGVYLARLELGGVVANTRVVLAKWR